MSVQRTENKNNFMQRLLKKEGRPAHFAHILFLVCGLVLTLIAFFALQSFIDGLVEDEKKRISQEFVEAVVPDFYSLTQPLVNISDLITLSKDTKGNDIKLVIEQKREGYASYSQIIWFYKTANGKWTFSQIWGDGKHKENSIYPDGALLKTLISSGATDKAEVQILSGVHDFKMRQYRAHPKIESRPLILTKAVSLQDRGLGFLVAVLDSAALFDDEWISDHESLSFMHVQDVSANTPILKFERNPGQGPSVLHALHAYELSFAGRKMEVNSAFTSESHLSFLSIFPYVAGAVCLFLVGIGTLYIRKSQQQSDVLVRMNDMLEQKSKALKTEAEERERLNQAIHDAEKKSRAVVDSVSDIIFEADKNGRIVFLSKAWTNVTGFDVNQSVGQKLEQLIHSEDKERVVSDFISLVNREKQGTRSFTKIRTSQGMFKAVELSMKMMRIAGEKGESVIGTLTDIEERRKVERALSAAEKKYRSIVENAASGIFQLTQEGLYLSANPALARILGYNNPEQLLREIKNANEQLYVDAARRQAFYRELIATREIVSQDVQMRKRDGEIIWVQESARAVKDENGEFLFFEGSVEDITLRRETEIAVHEAKVHSDLANRAKSEFLSNMSHELRTPLNSIIGFSEMIKDEVYGKIEQRNYWEYARDIHESGQKLLRVINEILDISKIEAGERQLNEGVVNIAGLVDSATQLLETKIGNAQMVITKALDDVPDVIGEELALKQVILNLLSNAVKFTPEKGRITISGHVGRDGSLHFSITDTGIGLDEYEIKKALSPFGQVDNELSRSGSGTGLGLTLVDALVKLHGGEFELFSQKGIGTTATIVLPAERIVKPSMKAGLIKAEKEKADTLREQGSGEDEKNSN